MSFVDPDETDDAQPTEDAGSEPEEPAQSGETVELAWATDSEAVPDRELTLAEAIEWNAEALRGVPDEFAFQGLEEDIDDLREEIDELRDERADLRADVDALQAEVDTLTDRIESLEGWKGDAVKRANDTSEHIRKLLTASDLDVQGVCPECKEAPLEKASGGWGENDRVQCSGDECDYVAEEME